MAIMDYLPLIIGVYVVAFVVIIVYFGFIRQRGKIQVRVKYPTGETIRWIKPEGLTVPLIKPKGRRGGWVIPLDKDSVFYSTTKLGRKVPTIEVIGDGGKAITWNYEAKEAKDQPLWDRTSEEKMMEKLQAKMLIESGKQALPTLFWIVLGLQALTLVILLFGNRFGV